MERWDMKHGYMDRGASSISPWKPITLRVYGICNQKRVLKKEAQNAMFDIK